MTRSQFSRLSLCAAALGALAITAFAVAPSRAGEDAVIIPTPAVDAQAASGIQTAVLAGGCFWGVDAVFKHVNRHRDRVVPNNPGVSAYILGLPVLSVILI